MRALIPLPDPGSTDADAIAEVVARTVLALAAGASEVVPADGAGPEVLRAIDRAAHVVAAIRAAETLR